jgi:Reverse transcriptase (RNA-dependent DNA polymerase)
MGASCDAAPRPGQVYIDNIAIHTRRENSETEAEHQAQHQEYIHQVLNKLEENNLYLKLEKCKFEQKEIEYLGLIVGENKLRMDPTKVQGVAK